MIKPIHYDWITAPLKFYYFVVKFQLPVGLVLNIMVATGKHSVFYLLVVLLHWFSFDCLKHREWRGVVAYIALFLLRFLDVFASACLYIFAKDYYAAAVLIVPAVGLGIFVFLCWVYFWKRRPLFSPYDDITYKPDVADYEATCFNAEVEDLIDEINNIVDSIEKS